MSDFDGVEWFTGDYRSDRSDGNSEVVLFSDESMWPSRLPTVLLIDAGLQPGDHFWWRRSGTELLIRKPLSMGDMVEHMKGAANV